jgi:tetratricopeptide (TPR) repeat protein
MLNKDKIKIYLKDFEKNTRLHLIILTLIPLILYAQCIFFGLSGLDDSSIIEDTYNRTRNIPISEERVQEKAIEAIGKFGDAFYRPVQFFTYIIDSTISGKSPWMYHLTNLFIYLSTGISLYFFLNIHFKKLTSFLLSLLFSIHPLFVSDAAWIPSRGDILINLFGIMLFISFYYYLTTKKIIYLIIHIISFTLNVFTKETTVLFPLPLLFYSVFILKEKWNCKENVISFILWILSIASYITVREIIMGTPGAGSLFGVFPFIKNLPVIPIMLGKFFIPINLSTIPLYDSISLIIGLIMSAIFIFYTFKYSIKKEWWVIFGLGWYLLFTIPPMLYRVPNADYYFNYLEHRAYLPIIGIIIAIAPLLNYYIDSKRKIIVIVSLIIFPVFIILSYLESGYYKNQFVFFNRAITVNPKDAAAFTCRGSIYFAVGKKDLGLNDINTAIKIHEEAPAYFQRAVYYETIKKIEEADKDYTRAIELDSLGLMLYVDRAVLRYKRNDIELALKDLNHATRIDSNFAIPYYNRGNIYLAQKKYNEAIKEYTTAISLLQTYTSAFVNRGIARYEIKDYENALLDYQNAVIINPTNILAYNNMGVTLRELGRFDEAISFFNKALSLNKNFGAAYYGIGTVQIKKGDIESACENFSEAARLGFNGAKEMVEKYSK